MWFLSNMQVSCGQETFKIIYKAFQYSQIIFSTMCESSNETLYRTKCVCITSTAGNLSSSCSILTKKINSIRCSATCWCICEVLQEESCTYLTKQLKTLQTFPHPYLDWAGLVLVIFSVSLEVIDVNSWQARNEQFQLLLSEDGDQSLGDDLIETLKKGCELLADCT